MVDELVRQRLLETAGDADRSQGALAVLREVIPTSLRQYIEQHIEQLSELALGVTKGQAAPELELVLTRAKALAQQVGPPSPHCAVLNAL
jgi:hypothetical protein